MAMLLELALPLNIFFVVFLIFVLYWQATRRPKNYPPGPDWLPMVGNLPDLKKLSRKLGGQHHAMQQLCNEYKTSVVGLRLGGELVVTACGYRAVHQILTSDEFEGRPNNFFIRLRCMGRRRGITCLDGAPWHEQRGFVTRHLRSLGFGKKPMEVMVLDQVENILKLLESTSGELRLEPVFAPSVLNVLWTLATGTQFTRDDARLARFLQLLEQRSKAFDMAGGIMNQMPWLRYVAPEYIGYNMIVRLNNELKNFFTETIQDHYKSWYPDRDDDLIYSFITEMKKNENTSTFTEEQLIMICLDLFFAGSTTTSNTLDFIFLEMVLHPEIQEKAAKCLNEAIPPNEPLKYADRVKVPYLEAIIMESERLHPVTPIIGPRRVLRDTILDGYHVPQNTTVLISIYAVHHDVEFWGDPEVYRPERFISDEGRIIYGERVLNFGLGRRRCLGELLARQCVFLFLAAVLRKYRVCPANENDLPSAKPLPGITLTPPKYKVKLVPR